MARGTSRSARAARIEVAHDTQPSSPPPGAPVTGDAPTLDQGTLGGSDRSGWSGAPGGGAPHLTGTLRVVALSAYEIEGELARGGLGRVLLARDTRLDRPVALKEVLHPDPTTIARFVREARLTARLQHPNIVPIYEAGHRPDGEPFYAMRLISGRTLTDVVRTTTTLDERLALVPALVAVADAIAYAHSQRIIHRDLKPDNVLLGSFGETIVIDWGLARDLAAPEHDAFAASLVTTASGEVTSAGAVVGTPAYMAPEQARGQVLDERSDVYSLGALVYHTLAGAAPYSAATAAMLLAQVDARGPVDITERQPDVPPDLATVIRKAMARTAADRYPSASQLADDLRRFQTGQLVSARRYSPWMLLLRWLRRHRGAVILSLVFMTALAALAAWSVGRIVDERNIAESRAAALTLSQARVLLDRDPTASLAWLRTYPASGDDWPEVRRIAAAAVQQGVARHVLALPEPIAALAFSADASRISITHTQGFARWHGDTGERGDTRTWDAAETQAFLPGHDTIVHADARGQLWRTDAGEAPRLICAGLGARPRQLGVSADGRWAALLTDQRSLVRIDLETGARQTIDAPTSAAGPIALAPDGSFVALASADATVHLWSAGGASLRALHGHQGTLAGLAFLDPARLVTAGSDGALRLWSSDTGASTLLITHPRPFTGLRVAPDREHEAVHPDAFMQQRLAEHEVPRRTRIKIGLRHPDQAIRIRRQCPLQRTEQIAGAILPVPADPRACARALDRDRRAGAHRHAKEAPREIDEGDRRRGPVAELTERLDHDLVAFERQLIRPGALELRERLPLFTVRGQPVLGSGRRHRRYIVGQLEGSPQLRRELVEQPDRRTPGRLAPRLEARPRGPRNEGHSGERGEEAAAKHGHPQANARAGPTLPSATRPLHMSDDALGEVDPARSTCPSPTLPR